MSSSNANGTDPQKKPDGVDSKPEGSNPEIEGSNPEIEGSNPEIEEPDSLSDGYDPEPPEGFFDEDPIYIDLTLENDDDDDDDEQPSRADFLRGMDVDTLMQNHQERGDLVELVKYELNDLQKRKDIDNVLLSKFNTYWNRMIDELNEAMQDLDCEPPVPSFVCQSFSAEALRYSVARNEILLPGYAKTVEDSKTAMGKVVNGFAKLSQQNQRMTRQLFKAKFTDSQLDNSLKALQLNSQMHSMSAAMIGGIATASLNHVDKLREVEYAIKTLNDKIDGLQCENQAVALCNREFRERIANYPGNEGESQMPISSEELVEAFREGFYENPLAGFSDHA